MATAGQASGAKLKKHSPLRIGDTIMLYFNADRRSKNEAENSGYILSDLSVTNNHSLILFPSQLMNPNLPNVQFATFKVLAENKYEAQARFNQEQQKLASCERKRSKEGESVEIIQAKKDVNLELNENRAKQRRLNGEPIFYGHNIQLLHTLTKKYLAANMTETSRTEHTKLKVNLQEQDGKGCIFKILPRYKVQSVGEEVHYSDQVMFESVAAEGQYLHCSKAKFGDVKIKVNKQCNELNLAATDSPLTIVRHYQPNTTEETDKVALKGGGTVRLYHKRHQSYVVAEGSFAGIFASLEEIKRVHRMHPDYRISTAHRSVDETSVTQNLRSSHSSYPPVPTSGQESHNISSNFKDENAVIGTGDVEHRNLSREYHPDTSQLAEQQRKVHSPSLLRQVDQDVQYSSRELDFGGKSGELDFFDVGERPENKGVIDEDVHFRRKRCESGIKKTSHTSANTFWQIEKLSDSISGEPINWNEKCRIKHLPTRMYLAVCTTRNSSEPKVKLVSYNADSDNDSTIFVLLPIVHQEGGMIHYESYSQIKHCVTDTWLHFNNDRVYQQRQLSDHGLYYYGSSAQETNSGATELFQICAAKELHEDAFILEQVEDELVTNFNYVAGITAVLTNQIKECREVSSWSQGPHHMHQYCHSSQTLDALRDLYDFLDESKCPRKAKNKQKLLRNLKVVDLIAYLVELHRDETVNDPDVCGTCFRVISKYLEGKSSKNKKYTTPMADYLFSGTVWKTELKDEHSIEKMLIGMVKNSPSLLIGDREFVRQVAKHVVDKLVQKYDTHQGPRLLDALSVLCVCNGVPIKKNQDQILSHLKEVFRGEGIEIFYSLDVTNGNTRSPGRNKAQGSEHEVGIEMEEVQRQSENGEERLYKESYQKLSVAFSSAFFYRKGCKYSLDMSMKTTEMQFLEAQLKLFVRLCLGDNQNVMNSFWTKPVQSEHTMSFGVQITFQHIMRVLDARIHPRIKTIYVELLQAMFVDVGKNRPFLDQLPYSFKLMEVTEVPFADTVGDRAGDSGDITALTKAQNKYFPKIKRWMERYFKTMEPLAADRTSENLLLAQILMLLATLVKYGYYDDPDDILCPLEKIFIILDGRNDFPTAKLRKFKLREDQSRRSIRGRTRSAIHQSFFSHSLARNRGSDRVTTGLSDSVVEMDEAQRSQMERFFKSDRFKNDDLNLSIFKVKKCSMEVLDLLLNYRFYRRLHLFIYDYRRVVESDSVDSQLMVVNKLKGDCTEWGKETRCCYRCCCSKRNNTEKLNLSCNHPRLVRGARERLKTLFSQSELNLNKGSDLPRILLDLVNYQDDDLIQGSLQLLDKYFSSESDLFRSANQTVLLISEKSVQFYTCLEDTVLSDLREYLDMKNVMDSVRGEALSRSSPLEQLTQKCWLEGGVVGCEPHHQNQIIIYNFGVLSSVIEFIDQYTSISFSSHSHKTAHMQQKNFTFEFRNPGILIQCLEFLRALSCDFKEVQKRLFQYVSLFLRTAVGDVAPYAARLLKEIFSDGPASSLRIKENEMKKMIDLVFMKNMRSGPTISVEGKAEFIRVLEELVMVRSLNLPVRHNQNLLIKCFNHNRDDDKYWCKELLREGGKDERLNLLKTEPDGSKKLQLLLMMTDLLAFCAQGENANTKSVCCTMYTIDEVLKIIIDPDIKLYRKRPFNRFLVWVYMNMEQNRTEMKALSITSNKKIWKWLDKCATLLTKVGESLRKISKPDYLLCKECLMAPVSKYAHLMNWKADKCKHLCVPGINGPTNEDTINLPDALLYLAEAVLPFIQVFYTRFFELSSCLEKDPKRVISENICAALMKFNTPFGSNKVYFSMDVQVTLYRRVMYLFRYNFSGEKGIKNVFPYSSNYQFEELEQTTKGCLSEVVITEARSEYLEYYRREIELNEHFHRFVYNYQLAYQGPNNVKAQIGAHWRRANKKEYSNFLDEEMTKPGHEYLPLGPAFQAHVACFVERAVSSTVNGKKKVKGLAERLLKQLEISANRSGQIKSQVAQRRQIELDIKCLQILRCIIYNHIMSIDPELKERNPQIYRNECSTKLHPVQRAIQNFGNAISRVVPLLSHTNEEIVYEVLAFIRVILESSNSSVQEGLRDLMNSKEHPIFFTLQRMLKDAAIAYAESQYLSHQMKLQLKKDELLGLSKKRKTVAKEDDEISEDSLSIRVSQNGLESISMEELVSVQGSQRKRRRQRTYEPLPTSTATDRSGTVGFLERLRTNASMLTRRRSNPNALDSRGQNRVSFMAVYQHNKCIPGLSKDTIDLIHFHDLSHIELIMKVLGLMCDGQYRDMQNFLRKQNEGTQSINIVGEVTSFLQVLYQSRTIDSSTIKLLHCMLQTLIEMSIGNCANQKVTFDRQIIPIINHILQLDITNIKQPPRSSSWRSVSQRSTCKSDHSESCGVMTSGEYRELRKQALELKGSAVEFLEGMLEETSLKTKELVIQLSGSLDMEALHGTLIDFYKLKHDKELIQDEYDDNAERGLLRTYHILVHLNHYGIPMESIEPKHNTESYMVWEECKKTSKSVEVVYKNDVGEEILTKVNFKFDPDNPIREALVDRVKLQIDRHSLKDKLRDLVEWMAVIKRDTNHHKKMRERLYIRPLISFGIERYYLLLFLTILMNVLVLVNYELPPSVKNITYTNESDPLTFLSPVSPLVQIWFSDYVLYILGGIHLFFSVWMMLEYFITNWPHFVLPQILFTNRIASTIRKALKRKDNNSDSEDTNLKKFIFEVPKRSYANVNVLGIKTIYVIMFLASSALSLRFSGYFYCLCLLYMAVNNDILQRALRSITKNMNALLWVAAFMVSILFIYAVASFAFLYLSFIHGVLSQSNPLYCNTLLQCFGTVIRFGLLSDLGTAIPIYPMSYQVTGLRLLFDISFFIIVSILCLNTILGIIVDTFSELRGERCEAEKDMKSVCFICGLYSYQFERLSDFGFKDHVTNEHNMWAYIYYSLYLDQIDISDHNAIEKYIHKKMKASDIDYFPMNRALALTHTISDDEKRLNELRTMVNSLQEMMERITEQNELG